MRRLGWRGIDSVNELRESLAIHWLYETCSSRIWAVRVAASRPYADDEELYGRAERVLAELTDADLDEALAGHLPRRGPGADSAAAELASYESKFGHPFVLSGDPPADVRLAVLKVRLGNPPDVERLVVRTELSKITRVRLEHALIPVHELVDSAGQLD